MNCLSKMFLAVFVVFMVRSVVYAADYNPRYWCEGLIDHHREKPYEVNDAAITAMVDETYAKGWRGVIYWGADRADEKIRYHFKSPFLAKQDWAVFENDRLTAMVKAAHAKGMKVMVNMEGVSPYAWQKSKWTPENIKLVADDLAADGVDAIFEECFEVNPDVFISFARELKAKNVVYISGTDAMLLREPHYAALWPETSVINIYNYYLKRNKIYSISTLAEHGTLGYGWAKYWGKPTGLISPMNRDWGIDSDYTVAVVPYLCMIRALQFRLDDFMIWGGRNLFDPIATQKWIKEYVDKQEKNRPVLDIVVLLKQQINYPGKETDNTGWNRLLNSGDAITSGAFNAGYNIVVSDKPVPADAYWVYAAGGGGDTLPDEVVKLFITNKPVFIQAAAAIPSGKGITNSWKTVLQKCGIDGTKPFGYGRIGDSASGTSLPENQVGEVPYTGYYKGAYMRFTGFDAQYGTDFRAGTVIPKELISGEIYCVPNKTYARGPFIAGKDKKYVVTVTALGWEASYAIADLLSGGAGILPTSNVWGIAGKNVTALLAIDATELAITIPGLADGSKIHVVVWDNKKNKKSEETVTYKAPYRRWLHEYDFVLVNTVK